MRHKKHLFILAVFPLLYLFPCVTSYGADPDGTIKIIDSALNISEVTKNVIVYKGTMAKYYTDWKEGKTYPIPAFFSTTIDIKTVDEFLKDYDKNGGGIILEILVPKGTSGLYLGTNSDMDWEAELLLNRNLNYKVLQRTDKTIKLEIVE